MTEKRFTIKHYEFTDWIYDNDKLIHTSKVVDLLNALHEENQALKSDRARYEEECRLDVFKELMEENEQLKQQLKSQVSDEKRFTYDSKTVSILKDGEFWLDGSVDTACNHSEICNELNALHEENEQLKHELNTIKNILFDLKEIESYWDSSILQNVIDNIAETVGVDLDD